MTGPEFIGKFVMIIATVVLISVLGAYPVKWIMNWLFAPSFLHTVFGTGRIGLWQAFWFSFLCGWIFRSTSNIKTEKK